MNTEIAQRWVDALRSGKYVQGRYLLKQKREKSDKYCCLGVLCELYLQDHPDSPLRPAIQLDTETLTHGDFYTFGQESEVLPKPVQEWAGIDEITCRSLAELNDSGNSFTKIADTIVDHAENM
jgi:hypothetical protein